MRILHTFLLALVINTSGVVCRDESNRKVNLRTGKMFNSIDIEEKEYIKGLDFFIMGWPKTGTSSMMTYLDSSDELKIVTKSRGEDVESVEFGLGSEEDVTLLFDRIEEEYLSEPTEDLKYGIKWPGAISSKGIGSESIDYLKQFNPEGTETKLLIGLRHPVRWFESFYNYRAASKGPPPPSASLIGSHDWAGVDTDRVCYEEGLMQLGNFPIPTEDEKWIVGHKKMGVVDGGTPYKVFIYLQEQLSDNNRDRHGKFLEDLSTFMEVEEPFTIDDDLPMCNKDEQKTFDICDKEHNEVRKVLVKNGKRTAKWIQNNLVETDGFTLPNKEHFLKIILTYGTDPCDDQELIF